MHIYSLKYQYFDITSDYHTEATVHICRVSCQKQKAENLRPICQECHQW